MLSNDFRCMNLCTIIVFLQHSTSLLGGSSVDVSPPARHIVAVVIAELVPAKICDKAFEVE